MNGRCACGLDALYTCVECGRPMCDMHRGRCRICSAPLCNRCRMDGHEDRDREAVKRLARIPHPPTGYDVVASVYPPPPPPEPGGGAACSLCGEAAEHTCRTCRAPLCREHAVEVKIYYACPAHEHAVEEWLYGLLDEGHKEAVRLKRLGVIDPY